MELAMSRRTVSGYVDESVADRLSVLARAEARSPAQIVGQALGFYVGLPEAARSSLRRIEAMGSPDEMQFLQSEFIRLLFKIDMDLTQRRMAADMGDKIPDFTSEEEIEKFAVAWTDGRGR
jgi:hypothetical protein